MGRTTPATALGEPVNWIDNLGTVAENVEATTFNGELADATGGHFKIHRFGIIAVNNQYRTATADGHVAVRNIGEEWVLFIQHANGFVEPISLMAGGGLINFTDGKLYSADFRNAQLITNPSPVVYDSVFFVRVQANATTSYKMWANKLSDPMTLIQSVAGTAAPGNDFGQFGVGNNEPWEGMFWLAFDRVLTDPEATDIYAWLQANKPLF